jgi:hypothetical protein
MLPAAYRVAGRHPETHDSVTLRLEPAGAARPQFRPGQFTMLSRPGIGEIAISVSGDPAVGDGSLTQTIRDVGAVSRALCQARPGDLVGVRRPFGTSWGLNTAVGRDLVIVAGGVGLAPLRPVVLGALADRGAYRRVILVAGARSPAEFLFRGQLRAHPAGGCLPGGPGPCCAGRAGHRGSGLRAVAAAGTGRKARNGQAFASGARAGAAVFRKQAGNGPAGELCGRGGALVRIGMYAMAGSAAVSSVLAAGMAVAPATVHHAAGGCSGPRGCA